MALQPPHSVEAEMSVLGGIMLLTKAWPLIEGAVRADDFYRNDHKVIFEACSELHRADQPCDFVTVMETLRRAGKLDDAGGPSYIGSLVAETYSLTNVEAYAKIVAAYAKRRRLIALCADVSTSAYRGDADDAVTLLETGLEQIGRNTISKALRLQETLDLTDKAIIEAKERRNTGGTVGVPTGIRCIDDRTGGLCQRRLIIVAARPGMGKTALLSQIGLHAASRGHAGLILSLEMGQEELGMRALANAAAVNVTKLSFGFEAEHELAIAAAANLGNLPLWIDTDTYSLSAACAQIAYFKRAHGIKWAAVDHIGLVETEKFNSRNDQLGAITRALKKQAKRLDIPIVGLCQLSRKVEEQKRRPQMSDLRDSGNIEQDADIVVFLHSDADENAPVTRVEVGLAKNRGGRKGWLTQTPLSFDGATQTFTQTGVYE